MISFAPLSRLFGFPQSGLKRKGFNAGGETILYLEQDPGVRAVIRFVLGRMGYTVVEASTTEEGLAQAGRFSFDLFLLNISLLDGWGIEFCRQARLLDPDTPVFFFSPELGDIHPVEEPAAEFSLKMPGIKELRHNIVRLIGESRSGRVMRKGNSTRFGEPLPQSRPGVANRTA
jgi:CheY-like chemotaxis protein